jgi:uncharacterized membrane protein
VEIAIILGLIAMVAFGIGNALAKIPLRSMPGKHLIFWRGLFSSIVLFVVFLAMINQTVFSIEYVALMMAIALIGYFGLSFFLKAVNEGEVSLVAPIANSNVVFTVLLSMIFFSEALSSIQIISIVTIIAGIFIVSGNLSFLGSKRDIAKGLSFALLACVFWGVTFFLLKIPSVALGPALSAFLLEFFQMIYAFLNIRMDRERIIFPKKDIAIIFLYGIMIAIAGLAFSIGVTLGSVSLVSALAMSNAAITVIYGRIIYKERLHPIQYMGILMIILGTALISLF